MTPRRSTPSAIFAIAFPPFGFSFSSVRLPMGIFCFPFSAVLHTALSRLYVGGGASGCGGFALTGATRGVSTSILTFFSPRSANFTIPKVAHFIPNGVSLQSSSEPGMSQFWIPALSWFVKIGCLLLSDMSKSLSSSPSLSSGISSSLCIPLALQRFPAPAVAA